MAEFTCSTQESGNIFVVRPSGYLNEAGGLTIRSCFESIFPRGYKKFLLDLAGTPVINSQGIAQIIDLIETVLYEQKAQLAFIGLSDVYVDVFHVVGILRKVKLFPDEQTALKEL